MYSVIIKASAQKQIKKLSYLMICKIEKIILNLQTSPRPVGCKKLVGSENVYRIRIGNYRIVYEIIDKELIIYIFDIDHRKDIYK